MSDFINCPCLNISRGVSLSSVLCDFSAILVRIFLILISSSLDIVFLFIFAIFSKTVIDPSIWLFCANHLGDSGIMYQGIKVHSLSALCYQAVFSVRRFDIVLVNLYFAADSPMSSFEESQGALKVVFFILIQICYLVYIHRVRPHDERFFNRVEILNEYGLLSLAYLMTLLTPYVGNTV